MTDGPIGAAVDPDARPVVTWGTPPMMTVGPGGGTRSLVTAEPVSTLLDDAARDPAREVARSRSSRAVPASSTTTCGTLHHHPALSLLPHHRLRPLAGASAADTHVQLAPLVARAPTDYPHFRVRAPSTLHCSLACRRRHHRRRWRARLQASWSDRAVGGTMIVVAVIIFVYFSVWILITVRSAGALARTRTTTCACRYSSTATAVLCVITSDTCLFSRSVYCDPRPPACSGPDHPCLWPVRGDREASPAQWRAIGRPARACRHGEA